MADGKWVLTEFESEEAVLTLDSLQWEITLPELYKRINFAENDQE